MSNSPKIISNFSSLALTVLLSGVATSVSVLSLNLFVVPFAWIALAWFGVTLHQTLSSKRPNFKFLWLNISVIIFTLGAFEVYLWIGDRNQPVVKVEGDGSATVRDEVLGYAPRKNHSGYELKRYGDEVIYKATYSTDANGLRITPPYVGAEKAISKIPCILFFGDSFTFGVGMNDRETMPYLVGSAIASRYITKNYAVHGYGPHQMLAQLERGIVRNTAQCKPKYAVYQAILPQIDRSAGRAFWDPHGPKYVLEENGAVSYKGYFDDYPPSFTSEITSQLKKSLILSKAFFNKQQPSKADVSLFIGIIDASRQRFEKDYPDSEFHVIVWDGKGERYRNRVLDNLKQRRIRTHLISKILPNYEVNQSTYEISDRDRHPNLLANQLITEYITKNIVKD